jgi:hypothetical protein
MRKLEEIEKQMRKKKKIQQDGEIIKTRLNSQKLKASEHKETGACYKISYSFHTVSFKHIVYLYFLERIDHINKENNILLERLLRISQGKYVVFSYLVTLIVF